MDENVYALKKKARLAGFLYLMLSFTEDAKNEDLVLFDDFEAVYLWIITLLFALLLGRRKSLFHHLPVDNIPNSLDIIGTDIAIVDTVRMFPNVNAQQRLYVQPEPWRRYCTGW